MRYSWTSRSVRITQFGVVAVFLISLWLAVSQTVVAVQGGLPVPGDEIAILGIFWSLLVVVSFVLPMGLGAAAPYTVSVDEEGLTLSHLGTDRLLEWRHIANFLFETISTGAEMLNVTWKAKFVPDWPKRGLDMSVRKNCLVISVSNYSDEDARQMLSTIQGMAAEHRVAFMATDPIPRKWRAAALATPGDRVEGTKGVRVW